MSPLLLKLLEKLGRLGVRVDMQQTDFNIGSIDGLDSRMGMQWKNFRSARALWQAWGPVEGSPWEPYHCVTLFAALDELKRDAPRNTLGPLPADPAVPGSVMAASAPPSWVTPDTLVMVDLPGPQSVTVGFQLALTAGCQPVCTFDNWPHHKGVLKSERVLATLLYYVTALNEARRHLTPQSPPVWLCDRERFTGRKPPPGGFDNRYIIEDRLLPGPQLLHAVGIKNLVYVCPTLDAMPAEDVRPYLDELIPRGIHVSMVATASEETWMRSKTYVRKLFARSGWSPFSLGLMRSSAGGFGGFVPQPSSGG